MVTGSSALLVERLSRFAARASYDDLSKAAGEQLKIRVLDALACAVGALDGAPVRLVHDQVAEFDGSGPCSLRVWPALAWLSAALLLAVTRSR